MNINDGDNRNKIIVHNLKLSFKLAKKIADDYISREEEIYQSGIVGLIKAVDTFDVNKKQKFSTYACICIRNEIYMYLRKEKNSIFRTSSYEGVVFENQDKDKLILEKILFNEEEGYNNIIDREIYNYIYECVNTLSEKEKKIITLFYGFDNGKSYKQKEIAEILGVSRGYVSKTLKTCLTKLRKRLLEYDKDLDKTYVEHIR
ncbi:MAG TPA: sigma-70 family RNA polymerase sigma factor [Tenericutes bacterium]|nr:sigma-70 family RNA polymerase sigma factor [Mycoplasmatota bacterium]